MQYRKHTVQDRGRNFVEISGHKVTHPYETLPPEAFWATGVARADPRRLPGLYRPRFAITPDTPIATAGSCFAAHIGAALRQAGCTLLDAEPAPSAMPDAVARRYGYRQFSGRYGNVYTARQMRQLLDDIADGEAQPEFIWRDKDRFRDAFRPRIEPRGLASPEEVLLHRDYHLERTSQMLREAEVFVFTLGLAEAWEDRATGRVFPVCPGVAGGRFDPARHRLRQFRHAEVLADLAAIHRTLRRFNPAMRLLLTVSPVPLTATATGAHVLAATAQAKATLRAAAGDYVAGTPTADYFPSYEIVTTPAAGGPYFAANQRSIRPEGVARVMDIFFAAHGLLDGPAPQGIAPDPLDDPEDEDACDDVLLEAFAQ